MSNVYETYGVRSTVLYFKTQWQVFAIRVTVFYVTERDRIRRRFGDSHR